MTIPTPRCRVLPCAMPRRLAEDLGMPARAEASPPDGMPRRPAMVVYDGPQAFLRYLHTRVDGAALSGTERLLRAALQEQLRRAMRERPTPHPPQARRIACPRLPPLPPWRESWEAT